MYHLGLSVKRPADVEHSEARMTDVAGCNWAEWQVIEGQLRARLATVKDRRRCANVCLDSRLFNTVAFGCHTGGVQLGGRLPLWSRRSYRPAAGTEACPAIFWTVARSTPASELLGSVMPSRELGTSSARPPTRHNPELGISPSMPSSA
jgi:hypothetical protein